jgi:mannosyl-oligosaccharide alpha-1,2-mannosidase
MGLKHEFDEAVKAVETIDFSTCAADEINVFETNIRYLGGFLAAYDLSGRAELLRKAIEIGSLLYKAFDTPNRMPITRWKFKSAAEGRPQVASDSMLIAEIGSLTLEFTRLSQVSGDPRYYDAVQRIMDVLEAQQDLTNLPGMWPVVVNAKTMEFNLNGGFTLGGMADSAYEYLPKVSESRFSANIANDPKQHLLLGGATQQYRNMYEKALIAMKRNIFFRPMVKNNSDLLFAGNVDNFVGSPVDMLMTVGEAQHLGCFAGGMVGIGARMFSREEDMATARKLMEGCLWAYENARGGIMPEILELIPCEDKDVCPFDEGKWIAEMNKTHHTADKESAEEKQKEIGLPHGVVRARDKRYILR